MPWPPPGANKSPPDSAGWSTPSAAGSRDWEVRPPDRGLALWARLPDGDTARFVEQAASRGVALLPGWACRANSGKDPHVRICFDRPISYSLNDENEPESAPKKVTDGADPTPKQHDPTPARTFVDKALVDERDERVAQDRTHEAGHVRVEQRRALDVETIGNNGCCRTHCHRAP